MKTCDKCGKIYDDNFEKCPYCNKLPLFTKFEILQGIQILLFFLAVIMLFIKWLIAILLFIAFIYLTVYISKNFPEELAAQTKKFEEQNKPIKTPEELRKEAERRYENKYKDYKYNNEIDKTSSNSTLSQNAIVQKEKKYKLVKQKDENIADLPKFYAKSVKNNFYKIKRARYDEFYFTDIDYEKKTAKTIGTKGNYYKTTLTDCTCKDFFNNKLACKHMLRLADKFGVYSIYTDGEADVIHSINNINDFATAKKLEDIIYRINKSYTLLKTNETNKLEEIGLITLTEATKEFLIDKKYNANELKGMLLGRFTKKTISKKELIELFLQDEKLVNKLPKDTYTVEINVDNKLNECLQEALYYKISKLR